MVLAAVDVPESYIVHDYGRSQKGLLMDRDTMEAEMKKVGLDETFSDAPAQIMVETLEYIHHKYGGCKKYLLSHGFTEENIQQLRHHLLQE